jgi:hypothetical protein
MEGKGLKSDYSDGVILNVQTRRDGRAANIAPRGMWWCRWWWWMQKGKCRSVFAVLAQPGSWSSWSQRDDGSNFPHYKSPLAVRFTSPRVAAGLHAPLAAVMRSRL